MMKADVLSGFKEIKVCTHYKNKQGEQFSNIPYDLGEEGLTTVYQSFEGWEEDLTKMTSFDELPNELTKYIDFIEKEVGVPIEIVSIGPDRSQTLIK